VFRQILVKLLCVKFRERLFVSGSQVAVHASTKIHRPEIYVSPKPEVTCGTVAIIIRVVLLSPYLRIRAVALSSIHYNQSHRVYINRRRQYICLI